MHDIQQFAPSCINFFLGCFQTTIDFVGCFKGLVKALFDGWQHSFEFFAAQKRFSSLNNRLQYRLVDHCEFEFQRFIRCTHGITVCKGIRNGQFKCFSVQGDTCKASAFHLGNKGQLYFCTCFQFFAVLVDKVCNALLFTIYAQAGIAPAVRNGKVIGAADAALALCKVEVVDVCNIRLVFGADQLDIQVM